MAAASVEGDFKTWLIETLNSSELDGEVYGDYIYGILEEGDEEEDVNSEETKRTELIDMLSGALATGDCIVLCQSIVKRWSAGKRATADSKTKVSSRNDPTVLLKEHIKTSKQATVPSTVSQATQPSSSALSDKEKSRLIIQYGSSCAGSDEENESRSTGDLAANANKSSVTSALKEMREEQRRAHQLKTERDRENKKAQQQKQQERKEKEKKRTQKQERKR